MTMTMQEIDDTEEVIRKVLLLSHPDLSMRLHYLTEAARRGVEENSAQDELNRIVDYIMGYWPAGFCYSHPLQAVTVLAGEMQRTQQRAEQLEAELAVKERDRQYHMDAINRLASFLALSGTSFEVVQAAIDNLTRLAREVSATRSEIARADEAINMHAADAFREKQRAEKAEAELAALKVERDEAVRREREACADACIEIADSLVVGQSAAFRCAEAIRARADQGGPADIGEAGCAHGLIPDNHADAAGDQSGPHPTEGGKS